MSFFIFQNGPHIIIFNHKLDEQARRGLQPRLKRFEAAAIFGPYEKPYGRGKMHRPAFSTNPTSQLLVSAPQQPTDSNSYRKQWRHGKQRRGLQAEYAKQTSRNMF